MSSVYDQRPTVCHWSRPAGFVADAIPEGGTTADAKVREASDAVARLVRS
jgi:hypothetical protein